MNHNNYALCRETGVHSKRHYADRTTFDKSYISCISATFVGEISNLIGHFIIKLPTAIAIGGLGLPLKGFLSLGSFSRWVETERISQLAIRHFRFTEHLTKTIY